MLMVMFLLCLCCQQSFSCQLGFLTPGASYHMCLHRDWFGTYEPLVGGSVTMGNDAVSQTVGIGSVRIRCHDGVVRILTDVRHVPDLRMNLISLGTLTSIGCKYSGEGNTLKITKGSLVVMRGHLNNGLYVLHGTTITGFARVSSFDDKDTTKLWHMRLGHMSQRGMNVLSKRGLLCGVQTTSLDFCEHCVYGKQKRVSFSTGIHSTKGIVDYIHSDLWGPSPVASKGGAFYFLTFIDDFSRKVWVYFLKHKSDVFDTFKK